MSWVESRAAVKSPTLQEAAPPTSKNYPAPNVITAKVEKLVKSFPMHFFFPCCLTVHSAPSKTDSLASWLQGEHIILK